MKRREDVQVINWKGLRRYEAAPPYYEAPTEAELKRWPHYAGRIVHPALCNWCEEGVAESFAGGGCTKPMGECCGGCFDSSWCGECDGENSRGIIEEEECLCAECHQLSVKHGIPDDQLFEDKNHRCPPQDPLFKNEECGFCEIQRINHMAEQHTDVERNAR